MIIISKFFDVKFNLNWDHLHSKPYHHTIYSSNKPEHVPPESKIKIETKQKKYK